MQAIPLEGLQKFETSLVLCLSFKSFITVKKTWLSNTEIQEAHVKSLIRLVRFLITARPFGRKLISEIPKVSFNYLLYLFYKSRSSVQNKLPQGEADARQFTQQAQNLIVYTKCHARCQKSMTVFLACVQTLLSIYEGAPSLSFAAESKVCKQAEVLPSSQASQVKTPCPCPLLSFPNLWFS